MELNTWNTTKQSIDEKAAAKRRIRVNEKFYQVALSSLKENYDLEEKYSQKVKELNGAGTGKLLSQQALLESLLKEQEDITDFNERILELENMLKIKTTFLLIHSVNRLKYKFMENIRNTCTVELGETLWLYT